MLYAFAVVQERSWPVCGGFERLQRAEIRHLRRMVLVVEAVPVRECV
jgi:hypothetical protein